MESYLQALPQDLHNVINNYVKDQIDLTIEILDNLPNLIIKSGRVTQTIRITNLHWNIAVNKEKFMKKILEQGDICEDLPLGNMFLLRFIRKNGEITFKFMFTGFEFYTEIEIPGSYKGKIFEYISMLKVRPLSGPMGLTGSIGLTGPSGILGLIGPTSVNGN